MQTFSKNLQTAFCVYPERCVLGTAPTLSQVAAAYGTGMAKAWILPQLSDLSEFCGCKDKLTQFQYEQLAEIIYNEYNWLKVTEIMLFFYRFKRGDYGRFYGSIDPLVITTALKDFIAVRALIIEREDQRKEEVRIQQRKADAISYDEHIMLNKSNND